MIFFEINMQINALITDSHLCIIVNSSWLKYFFKYKTRIYIRLNH